jgi:hypothetical protein
MTVTNHMTVRQAAEGRPERGHSEAGILGSKIHGAACKGSTRDVACLMPLAG